MYVRESSSSCRVLGSMQSGFPIMQCQIDVSEAWLPRWWDSFDHWSNNAGKFQNGTIAWLCSLIHLVGICAEGPRVSNVPSPKLLSTLEELEHDMPVLPKKDPRLGQFLCPQARYYRKSLRFRFWVQDGTDRSQQTGAAPPHQILCNQVAVQTVAQLLGPLV